MNELSLQSVWAVASQINPFAEVEAFLNQGGAVLVAIMLSTFALWMLILERFYYFWRLAERDRRRAAAFWRRRPERQSWHAKQVRRRLVSLLGARAQHNLHNIHAMVAIAPLLGLLGTVTGMINVFDVMAFSGSGNTRAMAAGVSKATIPTMAGMVVALTGMLSSLALQRRLKAQLQAVNSEISLGA